MRYADLEKTKQLLDEEYMQAPFIAQYKPELGIELSLTGEALNVPLPQKVACKVIETEPVVKGQTAANSFKPALLDNGVKVMVPPFIGQDEIILINTETKEYSERAS